MFVLGSHSKKRPHNFTLGRLYDFHLYDCLELGLERHTAISSFKGAGTAQVGNKVSSSLLHEAGARTHKHTRMCVHTCSVRHADTDGSMVASTLLPYRRQ